MMGHPATWNACRGAARGSNRAFRSTWAALASAFLALTRNAEPQASNNRPPVGELTGVISASHLMSPNSLEVLLHRIDVLAARCQVVQPIWGGEDELAATQT